MEIARLYVDAQRSFGQLVAAFDWSEPPSDELLSNWFFFGPSGHDIVE